MKILSVELNGIKSYDKGPKVAFHPGINFISGRNGSGKSTLLEAIGFAMFDHCNLSRASMILRNGVKTGRIDVTFTVDETTAYTVTRYVKHRGSGAWTIREVGNGLDVASGEEKVKQWLREAMNLQPDAKLDELYSQVIGVPQGEITTYFKETPTHRCDHFDPLMGTESYKKAFENSQGLDRAYANEIGGLAADIAGLEARCEGFDEKKARFVAAASELVLRNGELIETQKVKDSLDQAVAILANQKEEVGRIDNALATRSAELQSSSEKLSGIDLQLAESAEANKALADSTAGHDAYIQAMEEIAVVEPLVRPKEAMDRELKRLGKEVDRNEGLLEAAREGFLVIKEKANALAMERNQGLMLVSDHLVKIGEGDDKLVQVEAGQKRLQEIVDSMKALLDTSVANERAIAQCQEKLTAQELKIAEKKEELSGAPDPAEIEGKIEALEKCRNENDRALTALENKIQGT